MICTDPLFPLDRAVIVTCPDRFPVTTPLDDTVAVVVLELDQVKLWLGTEFPLLSCAVAVSCIVFPAFRFFDGAETATVATAPGLTLIFAVPLTLPTLAVIVAEPGLDVVT